MSKNIHWFPGHMQKALNEIKERIKVIDVVIEILDARCPLSSINEQLEQIIANKKKLIIISKPDLADPIQTKKWELFLRTKFDSLLVLDLTSSTCWKEINKAVSLLGKEKHDKEIAKGMKPQPIRAMIIGIPNVGKSSLINRVAKRKAAGVENKPGFTRGEKWIKVNNDFLLLDTPGILPMNYENKEKAANMALIGSIREDILPNEALVDILLDRFKMLYPMALKERFGIEEIEQTHLVLENIADKRKLLDSSGNLDIERAESLLLKEFKDGKLGRFTLEWLS